ncbi:MAG: malto-oligosyltrehalose synthase [Candidatus Devosia phytovorans]|uniref:Malto-oligosyltrehalose synthase n=1 Tax=Candidatus Devosia phytovorans TaxID=3121372 RepID=A0AAJ5VT88_9HYPH|nr:malto-oligosyltrehalose synthase [Devosia sp.]WEK04379.1 MAG: malto-oligosyltrehalose synthase [Devosia sp.]
MFPLRATYRLQLNKDFTFAHAQAVIPHLVELGVSHAYLSPILMARPGSTHGYDTVDHTRINPELGTLEEFRALVTALRASDMGVLLDFVPNHMGVGGAANPLWLDVLKHGKTSRYADWFDIDWMPPCDALKGKILVPFLGKSHAQCLADGDFELRADADGLSVWAHGEHKLPLSPETEKSLQQHYGSTEATIAALSGPSGRAALDELMAAQHWRAAHYATAGDEINYRRFFVNSDLAGIRVDRPDVFAHSHQLILQLIEDDLIDGLRIDHIDGLLDPQGYLETLRAHAPKLSYLVVEKILAPHERLRRSWPIEGTTGYEVGALLTRTLVAAEAEPALTKTYADFIGPLTAPEDETYACKLRIMDNELAAELSTLSGLLTDLAWSVPATADLTTLGLRRAVREVIAHLSVYRTYIDDAGSTARDRREIGRAIAMARRSRLQDRPATYDFLENLFCLGLSHAYDPALVAKVIGRFQQYSGPMMAKGLEDTALYRYNRLVALNEVGAHPDRFSVSIAAFHDANRRRLAETPLGMISTSTHDTKRGEDIRAVISTMADHPAQWSSSVVAWRDLLTRESITGLQPNELYLFFQLLLGGWPIVEPATDLADRLTGAMLKSAREARQFTDWNFNNSQHEKNIERFVAEALQCQPFITRFLADRQLFLITAKRKALIQTVLKLTIPGIPDIYRGAEDWEQSFVDPDNRRPLDFTHLAHRLADPSAPDREKLLVTQSLLQLRRRLPDLFLEGSYEPVQAPASILKFNRKKSSSMLAVLADLSPGHQRVLEFDASGWVNVVEQAGVRVLLRQ